MKPRRDHRGLIKLLLETGCLTTFTVVTGQSTPNKPRKREEYRGGPCFFPVPSPGTSRPEPGGGRVRGGVPLTRRTYAAPAPAVAGGRGCRLRSKSARG